MVFLVLKMSGDDLRMLELEARVALFERADDVERVDETVLVFFRRLEETLVLVPINLVEGKEEDGFLLPWLLGVLDFLSGNPMRDVLLLRRREL